MRRAVPIGAAALVLLAALALPTPPGIAQRAAPAAVEAALGVGALGRVEPASRVRNVTHGAGPEGARVRRLLVAEGDEVAQGQLLAELHDLPLKEAALALAGAQTAVAEARLVRLEAAGRDTEIAAARAQVAAATAAEESAAREARRAEQLLGTPAGNRATWDRARFAAAQATAERARAEAGLEALLSPRDEDLAVARAEVAAARAAVAQAEAARDLARIVAPIAGTVLKVHARAGERVPADGLLELADLSVLEVVAEVYETDLPRVRLGAEAEVIVPESDHRLAARVVAIGWLVGTQSVVSPDPVASIDARVVEVRLRLDASAGAVLRHRTNMQVQVSIRP